MTEEQKMLAKKRAELVRVQERLADPDLRPGISRAAQARRHLGAGNRRIGAGLIVAPRAQLPLRLRSMG